MERISPNVMLVNNYMPGASVQEFQSQLIEVVRTEFEHNFSQQIYVSAAIWTVIRNAKEDIARLINISASMVEPNAPSHELSKKMFDLMLEKDDFPTQRALTILKAEVAQLFG